MCLTERSASYQFCRRTCLQLCWSAYLIFVRFYPCIFVHKVTILIWERSHEWQGSLASSEFCLAKWKFYILNLMLYFGLKCLSGTQFVITYIYTILYVVWHCSMTNSSIWLWKQIPNFTFHLTVYLVFICTPYSVQLLSAAFEEVYSLMAASKLASPQPSEE